MSLGLVAASIALTLQKIVDAFWHVQERKLRHLAAMHRLDLAFNRFYNESYSCKGLIKKFQEAAVTEKMATALPHAFVLDDKMLTDLIDVDTKLKLFEFLTDVGRLNHDIENLRAAYRLLQEGDWAGRVSAADFVRQSKIFADGVGQLLEALGKLDDKFLTTWAYVQARFPRDKGIFLRLRERFFRVGSITGEEVQEARRQLIERLEKSTTSLGK